MIITNGRKFRNPIRYVGCRGGIIPYLVRNGQLVFGLGLSRFAPHLSDFGGSIEAKDSNLLQGAIREFQEETLGVFGSVLERDLGENTVLYSEVVSRKSRSGRQKMLIVFLPVDVDPMATCQLYQHRKEIMMQTDPSKVEVEKIVWLTAEELMSAVHDQYPVPLYYKVRNFFREVAFMPFHVLKRIPQATAV